MKIDTLMNVLEVLIMVSDTPLPAAKLCELVDHQDVSIKEVNTALQELTNVYEGRGVGLKKVGSGYRFQAREEYQQWFHKLFSEKPSKYSRALLETLAIVAYRQPVTRADVEAIRGVAVSTSIVRTLLERDWVKVVGHRDVPGKPSIYATTKGFLDYFNIARLDDLPPLSEVKELADIMEKGKQSEVSLKEAMEEQQQSLPLEEEVSCEETETIVNDEITMTEEVLQDGAPTINEEEALESPEEAVIKDTMELINVAEETIREDMHGIQHDVSEAEAPTSSQDIVEDSPHEKESTFSEKLIEEVTDASLDVSEKEEEVV